MKTIGFCNSCNAIVTIDIEKNDIEFGGGATAECSICQSQDVEPINKEDMEDH